MLRLNNYWSILLENEMSKEYFIQLKETLEKEYDNYTIYPKKENIFKALNLTDYSDVKVLILGQDPYYTVDVADGLAFSTNQNKLPSSLKNIYKELYSDLHVTRTTGDLSDWASQGVLLLNASLTVRSNIPNSHSKIGWDNFTNKIISLLNERNDPLVFVLWGNYAQTKKALITNPIHKVIESVHPSPLSCYRGFFGSKPFSKINNFLIQNGKKEIIW